jgi:hypothetical protein
MSENITIATLKDSKGKIEQILERVKKNLGKFSSLDPSEQDRVSNQIYTDFKYANNELESMKIEVGNLQNEQTQKAFKDQTTLLKQEIKKLQEEFTQKQNEKKNLGGLLVEDINLKVKANNELTYQEAIAKGDGILADDKKAIQRMINTVDQDLAISRQVKKELDDQKEKLEKTDKNLKEIDYSLNRAAKQIATMFKMYACDKLILCMIVVIVLVIIAIIIVAAVGGDKANNFNVPHDIFSNSNSVANKTRILFR